jgi:DNA methyltransferase 1-associated protein 1
MGDIADILGMNEKQNSSADVAAKFFAEKPKDLGKIKKKPKGMSREVFDLIGKDTLVPSMQSNSSLPTGAFKSKRASALKGKWVWASFTNSARSKEEGNTPFYHWVKADVQYTDYPYSKFNVKLDQIIFSDEEYEHLLKSDKWTRAETDHLMYICYKYDLRWPVISDRYMLIPLKKIEDIQERYYKIVTKIRAHRVNKAEFSTKNEPVTIFDCETERSRRKQQECLFQKTKSEEGEEVKLREELKMIDAVLRSKKEKVAKLTGADSKSTISKQVAAIANPNASNSSPFTLPIPSDNGPAPGRPCLQSTRLVNSDQNSGLSRVLLKKMNSVLRELGVSETPVPTRSVCDAYDSVKKDTITLLSLYNAIQKKEKEISSLKGLNPSDVANEGNATYIHNVLHIVFCYIYYNHLFHCLH